MDACCSHDTSFHRTELRAIGEIGVGVLGQTLGTLSAEFADCVFMFSQRRCWNESSALRHLVVEAFILLREKK